MIFRPHVKETIIPFAVCGIMAYVDNIEGCCTLVFVKELREEEPASNEQDFDEDRLRAVGFCS